jgi:DNA-directed RNA polymerase
MQAFMPNFIHSMDAANIHKLVSSIIEYNIENNLKINLFTIHDCFATTPNYMNIVNFKVKLAFIKLYFNNLYIEQMYRSFIDQIESRTNIYTEEKNGKQILFVINDKLEKIYIPVLPDKFESKYHVNTFKEIFINGINKSRYFIN